MFAQINLLTFLLIFYCFPYSQNRQIVTHGSWLLPSIYYILSIWNILWQLDKLSIIIFVPVSERTLQQNFREWYIHMKRTSLSWPSFNLEWICKNYFWHELRLRLRGLIFCRGLENETCFEHYLKTGLRLKV